MVNLRNLFIQWHNIKINDTLEVGRNGVGFSSARCIPDKFHNCDSMDAIMADLQEHKAIRPRVSFSALSCTRTYVPSQNSWYTDKEQRAFLKNVLKDAVRIKSLLISKQDEAATRVAQEDLVGIESLVFSKALLDSRRERKDHIRCVLIEQDNLRSEGIPEDFAKRLASLSATRSVKSVERARFCAILAL
eukprot:CAMPEP_0183750534 /NCGR_PEP_ID=MMETSP0739-20130205/1160_1 /TAXON_ID=385413 /ORGANISM="Thalassiosira miniscula, Strain CCMP1093" /LENGTH=189 /DNA_ID=CAMNT_0025986595 /DNA_START=108 /DNA_END=677 /DNA_ORIENTATION=+